MLVARKNSGLKRIITDFKVFSSKLIQSEFGFPLIGNAFLILRSSKCKGLPVLGLKNAYHTIKI